jgi:peptide deformylase
MGAESTRIDTARQGHDRGAFGHYIEDVMIRTILHYPDKRLREKGARVSEITPAIQALVDDMAETMYAAPGVGLAATQIGEAVQVFVIDVAADNEPSDLRVFINPEIVELEDLVLWSEGCLSFPGVNEEVERAAKVRVRAKDREGRPFELEAEGLLAVAIQHEHDHLLGILMIDHLGPLKKRLVSRKMQKRADADAGP